MPISRLYPLAQGAKSEWTLGAGSTKPSAMRSDDGDTSHVSQNSTTPKSESYSLDTLMGQVASIQQVDVASKAKRQSGGTTNHRNEWNINGADTEVGTCTALTGSYALIESLDVARPGGGSFAKSDFNGLTTGFQGGFGSCNTGIADATRCSFAYADVTWTSAGGGGFRWLLQAWIPPLIVAASHGLMAREIATALRSLKVRPSNREDFARILEAFRVRPRYAF